MNIYKIDLVETNGRIGGTPYEVINVAAEDMTEALRKAKSYLDDGDYLNIEVGSISRTSITLAK